MNRKTRKDYSGPSFVCPDAIKRIVKGRKSLRQKLEYWAERNRDRLITTTILIDIGIFVLIIILIVMIMMIY